MKVVIPMSGMSRRFMDAGYTLPKYLLKIDGKTVIEHIIDLYPKDTEFVCILNSCLLYTSPSPRDQRGSRMPSSA